MPSRYPLFDRSRLSVLPRAERTHDLQLQRWLALDDETPPFAHPDLDGIGARLHKAQAAGAARILLMGAHVLRAGEWLRSVQNADGGWGESCASYDKGSFVAAHSTASQTAWGVLGLIASGDTTSESLHKGVEFLVNTQRPDGRWHEDLATGTGFPKVFYLTYHMYRDSFPLMALAAFLKTREQAA